MSSETAPPLTIPENLKKSLPALAGTVTSGLHRGPEFDLPSEAALQYSL